MEEHDIRQRLLQHRYDEAFDLLVERAKDKIFRLSVSMLNNETQAQDLTQEVLIKIWKALPRYSGAASLSTWIYAITRNTCLTELKKRGAHPTVSLNAQEMEGLDPAMEDQAQAGAQMDVETLLARLPERYRLVVTLFYLEQKSYEEVAAGMARLKRGWLDSDALAEWFVCAALLAASGWLGWRLMSHWLIMPASFDFGSIIIQLLTPALAGALFLAVGLLAASPAARRRLVMCLTFT
jgi:RNA polymerase sigma-70 factor (ECF subfamily)